MSSKRHTQLCTVMAFDTNLKPHELAVLMAQALQGVASAERSVVTTKGGALVAFLGDPLDALRTAMALRKHASAPDVRVGVSLGAVQFSAEGNELPSLSGEPIDSAVRLAQSARSGGILADDLFYRIVLRQAATQGAAFAATGDAYEIGDATAGPATRVEEPAPARAAEPAKIFDAGANLVISGGSRAVVEEALARLADDGARVVSDIAQVGAKWMATATHAKAESQSVRVEEAGLMRIVTGPTREAVEEKVGEMTAVGARLVSPIELHEGKWTAVCDFGGG